MAMNSNTMSTKSDKSEHLCLVPDLREKAFNFKALIIMLLYMTL